MEVIIDCFHLKASIIFVSYLVTDMVVTISVVILPQYWSCISPKHSNLLKVPTLDQGSISTIWYFCFEPSSLSTIYSQFSRSIPMVAIYGNLTLALTKSLRVPTPSYVQVINRSCHKKFRNSWGGSLRWPFHWIWSKLSVILFFRSCPEEFYR